MEKLRKKTFKRFISYVLIFAVIPIFILLGVTLFSDRKYVFVSVLIAICGCIPFFLSFEKGKGSTEKIIVLAIMTALSVAGRFAFAYIPSFKPVTAIVMICGMYMGAESGFLCGALSALISNFFFMQGPWTPFQMFIWGIIGFISAPLSPVLRNSKPALVIGGIAAGIVYSLFMDVWTVLWWDNTFVFSRYAAAIVSAVPVTAVYAVSNVVFLLLLADPIGRKLERIKKKYGIG